MSRRVLTLVDADAVSNFDRWAWQLLAVAASHHQRADAPTSRVAFELVDVGSLSDPSRLRPVPAPIDQELTASRLLDFVNQVRFAKRSNGDGEFWRF